MNDSGQIVGSSNIGPPHNSTSHAFSWTPSGGMIDLGTVGGGNSQTKAFAVNSSGQVLGDYGGPGIVGPEGGFVWTRSSGLIDLGSLGGGNTYPFAENANGEVVGYSSTARGAVHAFAWTRAKGMVDLGTLPGDGSSSADAVNDRGQIVGESASTHSGVSHAVLWSCSGSFCSRGSGVPKRGPSPSPSPSSSSHLPTCHLQKQNYDEQYHQWKVHLKVTQHDGVAATYSVTLGSRFMSGDMGTPYVEITTKHDPDGKVLRLSACGYGHLIGQLKTLLLLRHIHRSRNTIRNTRWWWIRDFVTAVCSRLRRGSFSSESFPRGWIPGIRTASHPIAGRRVLSFSPPVCSLEARACVCLPSWE